MPGEKSTEFWRQMLKLNGSNYLPYQDEYLKKINDSILSSEKAALDEMNNMFTKEMMQPDEPPLAVVKVLVCHTAINMELPFPFNKEESRLIEIHQGEEFRIKSENRGMFQFDYPYIEEGNLAVLELQIKSSSDVETGYKEFFTLKEYQVKA